MANQLTAVSGSQSQSTTQSPQASVGSAGFNTGQSGSSVQPGTTNTLLTTSQGSVPLTNTAVTAVNLNSTPVTTATIPLPKPVVHHRINPVLMGFSGLLLVVAVVMFWVTARSAKNTTEYS